MVEKSADTLVSGPGASPAAGRDGSGPAAADTERELATVLADLLHLDDVAADSHFFTGLGANSMLMAQFCARVRKRPDLPSFSMKDIYRHPSVRELAAALAPAGTAPVPGSAAATATPAAAPPAPVVPASTAAYVLCGAVQLLLFLGYSFVSGLAAARGYEWVSDGSGLIQIYLRSVAAVSAGFFGLCAFPVAAKWILIGRWTPREFPVWSAAYLRFWLVKVLLHANPMILFIGNPLYVLYLRALGARIGPGVTILSRTVPVCTDLLTIGAGTVVRKDSYLLCYRAHAGRIQTGRVTLGRDVFVGEKTVLDIDSSIGDGAQLGHTSCLYRGQAVPDGQRWHGSPAQPAETDYLRVAPARCGTLRRACFAVCGLLQMLLLYLPLTVGGVYMLVSAIPAFGKWLSRQADGITSTEFLLDALVVSALLFFGFVVVGLAVLMTVPRLLNRLFEPDRVYPLYGFRYAAHRAVARMTNLRFYAWLFGDSSYIVPYLSGLGYDLSRVEQTGSNFGTEVAHETPFLVSVGSGTMVADGLSVLNAEYSSTSFRVSRATIGAHNFLGNNIAFPAGARTGENCLLATKVMVPLDGEVRSGVGLLGSPSFEIPRTVERDTRFDHLRSGDELRLRLTAKNRYNLRSMALMLLVRWLHAFFLTAFGLASLTLYGTLGHLVVAGYLAVTLGFSAAYYALVERCVIRFGSLRPELCSIYDRRFWLHERLWKVPSEYLNLFNGTPFKNLVWRMLGVRLGRRVFDDGCYMTERTLSTVGDDCTLNAGSKIQCHSQEDGTFKSDHSTLGTGCTLGVGAHVHYGVTLGDGAQLAADSFLMKGEEVPPYARWGGNPAAESPDAPGEPRGVQAAVAAEASSANGAAATAG
ncbi:Pls/PosA family non-ribosomal peptide synthetase [Streptomyces tropicalis]|uniref:Phosphopantetheine-binding protein n=1 Tax=Streptomyces tropicalis TaxID=3034234 RepID=A0ABT6A3N6_9ACTN|nr:Pls/PosA family non-ribosomal peptide synthetase [Streptomyces tropicalis]MDF3299265.1 phosphopantetheine-binding protein [Streptomyces tropicalis]